MLRTIAAVSVLAFSAGVGPAASEDAWPCEQELARELTVAPLQAGGPAGDRWRDDPLIDDLVADLAARRTPLDEATARVGDVAASLDPAARNEALAKLHAGIVDTIDRERTSIIAGIMRFTERQERLGARIQTINGELRALEGSTAADAELRRQALDQERAWDLRIFDERQGSLRYLCEQPDLLEERARVLSETIRGELG